MSKYGLSKKDLQFIKQNLYEPLAKFGIQVFIFGSRAKGSHRKYSDIDLLLMFKDQRKSDPTVLKLIDVIKEKFEDSDLPYKVDLVLEQDLPESFRPTVLKEKIVLFK